MDAYCDALLGGAFADVSVPPLSERERGLCTGILKMIWSTELDLDGLVEAFTDTEINRLLRTVRHYCKHRTLCTTEQGYIVLALKYAQPGDQFCTILDCTSSMLLRPAGRRWQVVGGCYVPALTDGEALAGPLPPGFRLPECGCIR